MAYSLFASRRCCLGYGAATVAVLRSLHLLHAVVSVWSIGVQAPSAPAAVDDVVVEVSRSRFTCEVKPR